VRKGFVSFSAKSTGCFCLCLCWLAVNLAAAGTDPEAAFPPDAAATVNGQIIPKHIVDVFLNNDREALNLDTGTEAGRKQLAELPAAIVDELVDRALIAQGVRERGVEPTEASLDADERRLVTYCGSDESYAAYTAQSGFNRREYRENVLRTTANGHAMIAALTRDVTVSDDEIKTYYDTHHADLDFQWPERVSGEHILINAQAGVLSNLLEKRDGLTPDTPEMNAAVGRETARRRALAETVRTEAVAPGADFAALAKKYSDDTGTREQGGSLSTFAHGVHPPVLDDAFFALHPGEIGPVVQTEFGFHVVRISARLPAGQKSLPELAPEIRRRLVQNKSARRLREWLAEARAKANIVLRESYIAPGVR
jgi:parvulin-like peptidyl-prolyl isomerase